MYKKLKERIQERIGGVEKKKVSIQTISTFLPFDPLPHHKTIESLTSSAYLIKKND